MNSEIYIRTPCIALEEGEGWGEVPREALVYDPAVDQALEQRLRTLLRVFLEENAKLNLSAMRTEEKAWIGHILDSISLLEIIPQLKQKVSIQKLIDIGTGGGFPLLPLAIALPEVQCIGLDSTGKKLGAIGRICEQVGITNVKTVLGRAEDMAHVQYRDSFQIVTSRAVADLRVLLEFTAPFASIGGFIVLWKSENIESELRSAQHAEEVLECKFVMRHTYTLPGDFGTRQLLVYEKIAKTPRGYPRKNGEPKKNPL